MNKLIKWIGGLILGLASLAAVPSTSAQQNYNVNIGGLSWQSGPSVPGSCALDGSWFWLNTGSKGWYTCVSGSWIASIGGGTGITSITPATGGGLTGGGSSGALSIGLITSCSTNQVLQWNGTAWVCSAAGSGTVTSITAGTGLSGGTITGSGTVALVTPVSVANGGSGASTLTGVIKGNGTSAFSAAASSDIIGLFSTCSGTQYLGADGACHSASTSSAWSALTNPTGNLSLSLSTNTSVLTVGDYGVSPGVAFKLTDNATSSTDNTTNMRIDTGVGSFHNPFVVGAQTFNQFQVCWINSQSTGAIVIGQTVTCPNLSTTPFAKEVVMASVAGFTIQRLYDGNNTPTGIIQELNTLAAPGTGFYAWKYQTGCSSSDTTTSCTPQASLRGDGLLTVPSEVISNLTAGTSPICPNGTGGALVNTGCGGSGTVTSITAGTGLTGGTITTSGTIALSTPVSVANGGTGTSSPGLIAGTNVTITGSWPNQTINSSGGGGGSFPTGVGIAGSIVSGTPVISQTFLPAVDVRQYFTTPYPTYTQAQSQDFGAVLNAALVAATASGACVDASGLNLLNAPNVTVLYASTNPFAGLTSNTYTPCIEGANFQVVTGATWVTPAGSLKIAGGVPGGIGGTGLVIQPCNTSTTCAGSGGFTVNQFPTSSTCSSSGGLNCYPTGVPSAPALAAPYSTGTVTCSGTTCTGAGTSWTSPMVGGTIVSSCNGNACTPGSATPYVTGRIVAVGSSTSLTLQAAWTGVTTSGETYLIYKPNTSVVWFDGGLGNSLQKSFTGHEIDDLTLDLNGTSSVGFLAKGSQEGSVLNNPTCFLQVTPTASLPAATAGGTCFAWDQTIRESSGSGQTFLGHWSLYGGRIGMGQNAGGSNAFGVVIEGFSILDNSVALSQANGPSVFELQADIGGGGSAKFQDGVYIDGISGMFIAGQHTESVINDDFNIGPNNPVYNVGFYNVTSSGTLGNCVIELHTGTSGNQIHGVSRPSGGCLAADDALPTPTLATSISGTPNSWTMPVYLQQGNAGVSLLASGNAVFTGSVTALSYQFLGAIFISGPIPGSAMNPTTSGNSAIGISNDGNLYLSNNGAAIDEFATAANILTFTNKTISGSSNTLSNIANASLINSSITIAGTAVSLGGSTASLPVPGPIGGTTPSTITGTTIQANTQINAGSTGTLAPIVMGNATSGLLTLQPATGAITSYTIDLPVAQPTSGNTFLSCTAANPAVCTWTSSSASAAESSISAPTTTNTITESAAGDWIARKGVEIANLTAPWSFANTNSTNNNTSVGLLAGAAGSSTGGIAALFYDVSGTGDLARFYSGGSVTSNAYTVGTLEASITTGGVINATTGYTIGGAAPTSGHYLRSNGTDFVDGTIAAGDLPGSGSITISPQSQTCTLGSSCTIPLSAINPQTATYQVLAADFAAYKTITVASGTFTITLVASGSQPAAGQYINVLNYGSGVVTIARSGQNINGGTTSITLNAGSASAPTRSQIWSDATNYFASIDEGTVGTVTSIATTGPITGGTITSSGTIACATCVTSSASLTNNAVVIGGGGQASSTISADTTTTHALFATATAPAFRAIATGDLPAIPLSGLATQSADTMVANMTASTAAPTAIAMPTTAHALWVAEGTATAPAAVGPGTSGQVFTSQGSSTDPQYIDFPERFYIPSANCNNTTAGAGWSIGSGGTVVCRAGTNNLGGAVQITDTSSTFAQFTVMLPVDWDTATRPYIKFYFSVVTDTTNGHTVIPQIKVSCPTAANGTTSDDATFSAAQSSSTVTLGASAVANGFYNGSSVQIGSTQMTGCIAGGMMIVQVGRATDTVTGNVNFWGADLTFPRQIVVQAN